jgi:hypothetical protein
VLTGTEVALVKGHPPILLAALAAILVSAAPGNAGDPPRDSSAPGVRLTLRAHPHDVFLGQRVRLRGSLHRGRRPLAGRRLVLQGDPFPFGDGWRRLAATRTNRLGGFLFRGPPRRNTRFRVRSARPQAVSRKVKVYADYAGVVRVRHRRPRLRMAFVIVAPSWAPSPAGRRVFFYVARRGETTMPQVARSRMRRVSRGRFVARASARARRLRRRERVWACWPEPTPDGLGRRLPIDETCGPAGDSHTAGAFRRQQAGRIGPVGSPDGDGLVHPHGGHDRGRPGAGQRGRRRGRQGRPVKLRGWDSNPQPTD